MVFLGQPLNDHEHLERCLLSFKQQGVAGVIYLASDTRTSTLPSDPPLRAAAGGGVPVAAE
jgi:LacI family transcriptional regulator of maltose regulon